MRLEAIEMTQWRGLHLEDFSDDEEEKPNRNLKPKVEQDEEMLLRFLSRENDKPTIVVSCYDEILEKNVVLGWITKMDKYFEYEGTRNKKKVKIPVTKLKGHASVWWDHL